MTDEELMHVRKYFERLLIATETKEQSELMWLMIRVGLIDYGISPRAEVFAGGFLLCEMCVPEAPFPSTCLKDFMTLHEFLETNALNYFHPEFGQVSFLHRVVLDVEGVINHCSDNGTFDAEAYRSIGIRERHSGYARWAMRGLRARLDARSNILLTSVLAHHLDLICHCPFGLRPRY